MYNHVTIIGRVGNDPEIRATQSGKKVCRISVATQRVSGSEKVTDWHRAVCFDRTAENCEKYVRKGSVVCVDGQIQYNRYRAKDGTDRTETVIMASRIVFMPSGEPKAQPQVNSDGTEAFCGDVQEGDEIPF